MAPEQSTQEYQLMLPVSDIEVSGRVRFWPGQAYGRLVASVRAHGVLQPLLVRPAGGRYRLIAGEQRLQAAREVGLPEVPVRVLQAADAAALEYELAENLTRSNLNPMEQARGFYRLWKDHGLTHGEIAEHFGITESVVSNRIRLLRLPQDVQDAVAEGRLAVQGALVLLRLEDTPELLAEAARRMVAEETPAARAHDLVDAVLAAARPTARVAGGTGAGGQKPAEAEAPVRRGRPRGSGRQTDKAAAAAALPAAGSKAVTAGGAPPASPDPPAGMDPPGGEPPAAGPDPAPPYHRQKMMSTDDALRAIRRHLMSCTCRPSGEALNALTDLETILRSKQPGAQRPDAPAPATP